MINRYGLDMSYFERELSKLKESLDNRPPDEVCRYLISLAIVASPNNFINIFKEKVKDG